MSFTLRDVAIDVGFRGLGIGCLAGFIYGKLFNANPSLAAQAFAIYGIGRYTFENLAVYFSGGYCDSSKISKFNPRGFVIVNPKIYKPIKLIGDSLIGITQIVAFRQLNLIASRGTAFFALGLMMDVVGDIIDPTLTLG